MLVRAKLQEEERAGIRTVTYNVSIIEAVTAQQVYIDTAAGDTVLGQVECMQKGTF